MWCDRLKRGYEFFQAAGFGVPSGSNCKIPKFSNPFTPVVEPFNQNETSGAAMLVGLHAT